MADLMTIVSGVAVPITGFVIMLAGRWIVSGQKDIRKEISDLAIGHDRRLVSLESENRQFMDKREIVSKFDHERSNRDAANAATVRALEKVTEDVVRVRESVARLDQNDTYITSQFGEMKGTVERRFDKIDAKMDKMIGLVRPD